MVARGAPSLLGAGTAALGLAFVVAVGACAGDPVDSAEDDPFRAVAIGLCGELIDSRVHAVWSEGLDASLRVLELAIGGGRPERSEIEPLTEALTVFRDDFSVTVSALAELGPPDEFAENWGIFVAEGTDKLAAIDARIAALADWDTAAAAVQPNVGNPPAVNDALLELGLLDRDCANVFYEPGPIEGFEGWVTRAAGACSVIAERRLLNNYEADADMSAAALAAVAQGVRLPRADELPDALQRLADEWRATYEEFASLDPAESPAPDEWQRMLDYSSERAELFAARAQAAESGDRAAIVTAFAGPEPALVAGLANFQALGLGSRDCRAIQA